MSRGNKRGHGGEQKEWSPFAGVGQRLGNDGEISQSIGDGGKTPLSTQFEEQDPFNELPVRSMASGSGVSGAEICNDIIDLEAESHNTNIFCPHPEWACMAQVPSHEEWQQNDRWTLADLVIPFVRSHVFASGDLGSQLLPHSQLVALRQLCHENQPSMVVVLQDSALAILRQTLGLLGHDATDNLPRTADLCLREGLITPLQQKYLFFLSEAEPSHTGGDQHGGQTPPGKVGGGASQ